MPWMPPAVPASAWISHRHHTPPTPPSPRCRLDSRRWAHEHEVETACEQRSVMSDCSVCGVAVPRTQKTDQVTSQSGATKMAQLLFVKMCWWVASGTGTLSYVYRTFPSGNVRVSNTFSCSVITGYSKFCWWQTWSVEHTVKFSKVSG